jgi:hypothetical protein
MTAGPFYDPTEIVDDLEPRREAAAWAYGELGEGREAEAVVADLLVQGWSQGDAEEIVEDARRQTRHRRGVVTRDDVARSAESRYRSNLRHNPLAGGGGMFGVLGSFFRSLASLFRSRKPPGGRPPSFQ